MGSNTQFMVDALSMFPEEYGLVDEIYPTSDPQDRFIVVFEDDPRNWSSRLSIAKGLNHLVNVIPLVGTDGATDYVHTEALSTYPLESVKEKTALFLLKELKITGAEYCNVLSKKHFFLCGVEDEALYNQAEKLWRSQKMSAFFELEGRRAAAMLDNLLIRMSEQKTNVSALTCCGNLPELICELMKLKGVSYARIKPKAVFLSDPDKYDARIRGEPLTLEKIISELPNESEWPNDGDWENLNLHKVHHLLKRTQKDIELKEAIPELNDMLSTSAFKQLSPAAKLQMLKELPFPFWIVEQFLPESELRILDKSELRYLGLESMLSEPAFKQFDDFEKMISDIVARVPANDIERIIKSSAVLPEIKASIVAQRSKSARPKEFFFGWLGLIAGIAGSLLGFAEDQLFRLSIIALFGLGVINCLVIRRYRSGIRWLVNGIIFIIGFYVYGHWGILIGFGIAYLISVLIIRPSVDDNSNSNI